MKFLTRKAKWETLGKKEKKAEWETTGGKGNSGKQWGEGEPHQT